MGAIQPVAVAIDFAMKHLYEIHLRKVSYGFLKSPLCSWGFDHVAGVGENANHSIIPHKVAGTALLA